jgi:hypothetical protein
MGVAQQAFNKGRDDAMRGVIAMFCSRKREPNRYTAILYKAFQPGFL